MDFTIIEREEEAPLEIEPEEDIVRPVAGKGIIPEEIPTLTILSAEKNKPVAADLPLEIKSVPDPIDDLKEERGAGAEGDRVQLPLPDYEPTLDLRDYNYPSLYLLAAHGSDQIGHESR